VINLRDLDDLPSSTPRDVLDLVRCAFSIDRTSMTQEKAPPTVLMRVAHWPPSEKCAMHVLPLDRSPDPLQQIKAVLPGRDTPVRGTHVGCIAAVNVWMPRSRGIKGAHGMAPPKGKDVRRAHLLVGLTVSGWTVERWRSWFGPSSWRLADPEEYGEAGGDVTHALNTLNLRFLSLRD
jgi:hypothetical protein